MSEHSKPLSKKRTFPSLRGGSKSRSGTLNSNPSKDVTQAAPYTSSSHQEVVTPAVSATPVAESTVSLYPESSNEVNSSVPEPEPVLPQPGPTSGINVFTPTPVVSVPETMDVDQPPTNAAVETSKSDVAAGRQAGDHHELEANQHQEVFDIAKSIKGMYRILDLISDQGSGGLGMYSILSNNWASLTSPNIWLY